MTDAKEDHTELDTRTVRVGSRVYHLNLRENDRGKFVKLVCQESGGKTKMIIPEEGALRFRDGLKTVVDQLDSLAPFDAGKDPDESPLHAIMLPMTPKIFYLDLLANQRGRFLKITSATTTRVTFIVPERGIKDFYQAFDLLVGKNDVRPAAEIIQEKPGTFKQTPGSKCINIGKRKRLFLDAGNGARGGFLRIAQVADGQRSTIVVPYNAIRPLQEVIGNFASYVSPEEEAKGDQPEVSVTEVNK